MSVVTLLLVLAMALATMLTRFLPFLLPSQWLDAPWAKKLVGGLPPVILLVLVVYSLKGISLAQAPWGVPELAGTALAAILQWKFRQPLVSIVAATGLCMLLLQWHP